MGGLFYKHLHVAEVGEAAVTQTHFRAGTLRAEQKRR